MAAASSDAAAGPKKAERSAQWKFKTANRYKIIGTATTPHATTCVGSPSGAAKARRCAVGGSRRGGAFRRCQSITPRLTPISGGVGGERNARDSSTRRLTRGSQGSGCGSGGCCGGGSFPVSLVPPPPLLTLALLWRWGPKEKEENTGGTNGRGDSYSEEELEQKTKDHFESSLSSFFFL